ncbi:hypothetical protein [Rhizobium laguerreae]|uniref:hypothetical protein n=1 Tax=Rhizobium laguerreae TaxID=1076926 RepID=UPI0013F14C39|nr:hypothetical protein [Rhizobium laguerreae]
MLKPYPVKTKLAAQRKTSGAQEKIWPGRLDEHVQPYLINAPELNSVRLKRDRELLHPSSLERCSLGRSCSTMSARRIAYLF